MYNLTDRQIEFIRNDIRARGVAMVSLQHDLLDHVCCVVEHGLEPDGDFEAFYSRSIRGFFKDELREIEQETITLLTFKHYYFMKKLMLFTGAASTVALSAGLVFKFMHWPGAAILIFLGVLLLSFLFLPLLFVLKAREKQGAKDKIILGIGMFAAICISLSVLFKLFHWPFANMLGLIALGITVFVFLPFYFLSGIRNPDTKVNTIVSSVLILYSCALLLVLVRSPKASMEVFAAETESVYRSERILETQKRQNSFLSKSELPTDGKNIVEVCEEVKSYLMERETGSPKIGNSKETLITDGSAGDYLSRSREIEAKLVLLNKEIANYNSALSPNQQKVEGLAGLDDRRVSQALNDLIQAQMVVLQNQSAVVWRN